MQIFLAGCVTYAGPTNFDSDKVSTFNTLDFLEQVLTDDPIKMILWL